MTQPRPNAFPLRLPRTTRADAHTLADRLGVSMNEFILAAINEKILRLSPDSASSLK